MILIFSLTLFLSAFLLFWIQPMFAKLVLPLLGGSPSVWNTCMVFYQAALLGGYAYAHLSARLGRWQPFLHMGLLAISFFSLPPLLAQGWMPHSSASPAVWLLLALSVSIGLPFFAASATAPMLQGWFSKTAHPSSKDPYFLYAASNAGSMAALIGYPFLIEPNLSLGGQSSLWLFGYMALASLIMLSGLMPSEDTRQETTVESAPGPRRLRWLLLSFAPSSLLLGVTTHITMDIAAVPLLWIIPLTLYLLSFVMVFARRQLLPHSLMLRAQPLLILPVAVLLFLARFAIMPPLLFPFHILMFFATAMVCHGELAKSRPEASRLTEFYLWISIGGVLGGIFNAIVSPLVFTSVAEYPIAIALSCLLRPGRGRMQSPKERWLDFALPLAIFLTGALAWKVGGGSTVVIVGFSIIASLIIFSFSPRPLRFGLAVGALMFAAAVWSGKAKTIYSERNFFGILRVKEDQEGKYIYLLHGTTIHGRQGLEPSLRKKPLGYYHREGPVGEFFRTFPPFPGRKVAIVGLGAGVMSAYAGAGERWSFYEIDPAVERIARRYFTYLDNCPARVEVILGDARMSLARAPEKSAYDLILLDAFSSDAIPVHLLTKEALTLYLSKLKDDGVLAFHISNRHLDLKPILGRLALDAGLAALARIHRIHGSDEISSSDWVVMAKKAAVIEGLSEKGWKPLEANPGARPWTDDFSNILSVIKINPSEIRQ